MDLSDIFKFICFFELVVVSIVGSILIYNSTSLIDIVIFYSAGVALNFILFCFAHLLK